MIKLRSKFAVTFISLFSIGFVVSALLVHFALPNLIVSINSNPNPILSQTYTESLIEKSSDLKFERIIVTSQDGLKLSSNIVYSKTDTVKGTIIFLHGIRDNKSSFVPVAIRAAKMGYNAVFVDSRAHGASEGRYTTFGYYEKYDLKKLIDSVKCKTQDENIGIWGHSLGAAIGLQTMAIDKRIKFGIIESTFSDLRPLIAEYVTRITKLNSKIFSDYLLQRAGAIAQFEPDSVKPFICAEKITCPVLIVHGSEDKRILPYHASKNYKHLSGKDKAIKIVKGARHATVWKTGGEEYFEHVFSFLSQISEKNE